MWKVLKAGSRLLQLTEEIWKSNHINFEGGMRSGASHPAKQRGANRRLLSPCSGWSFFIQPSSSCLIIGWFMRPVSTSIQIQISICNLITCLVWYINSWGCRLTAEHFTSVLELLWWAFRQKEGWHSPRFEAFLYNAVYFGFSTLTARAWLMCLSVMEGNNCQCGSPWNGLILLSSPYEWLWLF